MDSLDVILEDMLLTVRKQDDMVCSIKLDDKREVLGMLTNTVGKSNSRVILEEQLKQLEYHGEDWSNQVRWGSDVANMQSQELDRESHRLCERISSLLYEDQESEMQSLIDLSTVKLFQDFAMQERELLHSAKSFNFEPIAPYYKEGIEKEILEINQSLTNLQFSVQERGSQIEITGATLNSEGDISNADHDHVDTVTRESIISPTNLITLESVRSSSNSSHLANQGMIMGSGVITEGD